MWVSAACIPGTINTEAGNQSRVLDATEWKFNPALFQKIIEKLGKSARTNKLSMPSLLAGTRIISIYSHIKVLQVEY